MNHRPLITFKAFNQYGERYEFETTGIQVIFGLVLHYTLDEDGCAYRALGFTVSEPITGGAVVHGYSVLDAMNKLRKLAQDKRRAKGKKFLDITHAAIIQCQAAKTSMQPSASRVNC